MKKIAKLSLLIALALITSACNLNFANLTIESKENVTVTAFHYDTGRIKTQSGKVVRFKNIPAGKYELTLSTDYKRHVMDINLKEDKIIDFSFDNVKRDQAVEKAFRNINFGDSKEVVKAKVENDPELKYKTHIKYKINDMEVNIIHGYYNNQLCELQISGGLYTADYFDTKVKLERNKFLKLIRNQYGIPDESNSVGFFDVRNGYIRTSHKWESEGAYDNKKISIGIGEQDSQYYAALTIGHKPLLKVKEKQQSIESYNNINESSNSF